MEIEVKLRLPNKAFHQKLLSILSPFHIATHHQKMLDVDSRVLRRVKEEFGIDGIVSLGRFRNVYKWNEVKLEVDEVNYDFGDLYELECESTEPERVKGMITEFLKDNGIEHSDSVMSKFAIFRAGKLPS